MASKPSNSFDVTEEKTTDTEPVRWLLAMGGWLWKPLLYSSAYLAVVAMAEVVIVRELLSLPASVAPFVLGLTAFAIYANDRLVDLETDAVSNPRRTAFVQRHRDTLYVLAALAYGLALALSVFGGPLAFGLTLLPAVAWVLYAIDWVPTGGVRFQRLKEVLLVNSAVVALAWALPVVFLPLAFSNATLTPTVGLVFLYFALGAFVSVEVANVKDIESDRQSGAPTLAVVYGVRRTRWILGGTVLLTALVLGYGVLGQYLTGPVAAVLSVGLICLSGVVALLGRTEREDLLTVAAECARLPVLGLLLVLTPV